MIEPAEKHGSMNQSWSNLKACWHREIGHNQYRPACPLYKMGSTRFAIVSIQFQKHGKQQHWYSHTARLCTDLFGSANIICGACGFFPRWVKIKNCRFTVSLDDRCLALLQCRQRRWTIFQFRTNREPFLPLDKDTVRLPYPCKSLTSRRAAL